MKIEIIIETGREITSLGLCALLGGVGAEVYHKTGGADMALFPIKDARHEIKAKDSGNTSATVIISETNS